MPGAKQRDAIDGPVQSVRVGDLEPVNLLGILDETRAFIKRFCVFPNDHCLNAVSLWAVHAHVVQHLYTTARLAVISPELASGKTRVLEILNLLVPLPEFSFSASTASIFRLLAKDQITLLFDEVDTIWSKHGKDDSNEDLRALLNAGYKKRCSNTKMYWKGLRSYPLQGLLRSCNGRNRQSPGNHHVTQRHYQHAPASAG